MTTFEDLRQAYIIQHGATAGSWFGLPALKINGKVCAALWTDTGDLIVKLPDPARTQALDLPDAHLFQPLLDRRPMREWVQIPAEHHTTWPDYVAQAFEYVQALSLKKEK